MTPRPAYLLCCALFFLSGVCSFGKERVIRMDDWKDRMKAAWIGKMAGVGWGITTEFRYSHRIVPDSLMYDWSPEMVNEAFNQDDMYLSVFNLELIEKYGCEIDSRTACIERASVQFEYGGRNRLVEKEGIAPPDVAHPHYKKTSDGCGYTCGADYAGIIAPGLPQAPVHYGDVFGSYIGYGDGIYGGVFVGALYCEAFFNDDIHGIVMAALKSIPEKSLVYQAVEDVMKWHRQFPDDWRQTWQKVMDLYWWNEENNWTEWPYGGRLKGINLDSKSMCAFTVMALLYGEGDLEKTMRIAIQASEDADCDASIAAGVLCASKGMEIVDDVFFTSLKRDVMFKYTDRTFDGFLSLTESVARKVIPFMGGRIEVRDGEEFIVVPKGTVDNRKSECRSSKTPGPLEGATFTCEELDRLELMSDPGFETQSSAWSFFLDNRANHILEVRNDSGIETYYENESRTGLKNAALSLWYRNGYRRAGTKIFSGVRQAVLLAPENEYRLSCWVRTSGDGFKGRGRLTVRSLDGEVLGEAVFGEKPEWTKVGLRFNSGEETAVVVEAGFYGADMKQMTCRFDDFSMKKTK